MPRSGTRPCTRSCSAWRARSLSSWSVSFPPLSLTCYFCLAMLVVLTLLGFAGRNSGERVQDECHRGGLGRMSTIEAHLRGLIVDWVFLFLVLGPASLIDCLFNKGIKK